ncbi:MAG: phosphonate C-P lyase system protein PhnH [Chloroflexi bacterium]|nr:phosphonate C-P lyase system protein PhnH [Chloroflexota bacterium]
MTPPVYTPEEARTRQTFLSLMWALSYPGKIHMLPFNGIEAFHAVADTLLDLETSYYCPDDALALHLSRSGARALDAESAAYHFYPHVEPSMMAGIGEARTGTLLSPDLGATLVVGCTLGTGTRFTLTGPGVPLAQPRTLTVESIPPAFWELLANANRYPRGWDIYLIDGDQVVGLPRTTKMTLKAAAEPVGEAL